MILFTLEKCKTRAGYSAKLPSSKRLNLSHIKKEFEVLLETPILLVVKVEGMEIVVHGFGELLFKNSKEGDLEKMRKVAEKIYDLGLKN